MLPTANSKIHATHRIVFISFSVKGVIGLRLNPRTEFGIDGHLLCMASRIPQRLTQSQPSLYLGISGTTSKPVNNRSVGGVAREYRPGSGCKVKL